jgi:3-dehydroquinate dehydratase I
MPVDEPVKKRAPRLKVVGVVRSAAELRLARRMKSPPDLFEVRLDCLPGESVLERKLSALPAPLIITARHPAEGGKNNLPTEARRDLLLKFLTSARYVDVELRSARSLQVVLDRAERLGVETIISLHDLKCTPSVGRLRASARRAQRLHPAVFKIATRTDTAMDLSRLIQFVGETRQTLSIAAMGVGRLGAISRLALARIGSVLVYCSMGDTEIEGQLSVDRFRLVTDQLRCSASR